MKYLVIEIQTDAEGIVGNLVTAYDTKQEAESAYLTKRISALNSTVNIHTVLMIDNRGRTYEVKPYVHPVVETPAETTEE